MKITKVKDVKTPTRGTSQSAGIDFYIPNDSGSIIIEPFKSLMIPSGIKVNIPKDHALIGFNKSGIALKGLQLGACLIDEDYQGEIHIHLFNVTDKHITLEPGQKIVQFVLTPVNYCSVEVVDQDHLHETVSERGEGGFGSTGL